MNTRLKKTAAAAGIGYPVLQMAAQGLIQIGGAEPSFSAPANEILAFFAARDLTLFNIGGYISGFSGLVFIWFLGALWDALRTDEGGTGWLSMIAVGSGIVSVTSLFEGGWFLAIFRLNDGLDPQLAQMLFDQGNFSFANSWLTIGSMVLVAGLIIKSSPRFPRWLGWASIVLAVGLLAGRAVWTSSAAFGPYVLYWAWLITMGIILMRRASKGAADER